MPAAVVTAIGLVELLGATAVILDTPATVNVALLPLNVTAVAYADATPDDRDLDTAGPRIGLKLRIRGFAGLTVAERATWA